MKGYWRIEKKWVHEWGLTPTECIVLADMHSWQGAGGKGVTQKDRAERCGLSVRGLRDALGSIAAKTAALKGQILPQEGAETAALIGKNCRSKAANSAPSPHTPYNKVEELVEERTKNKSESYSPPIPPAGGDVEGEGQKQGEMQVPKTPATTPATLDPSVVVTVRQLVDELRREVSNNGTLAESAMRLYAFDQPTLLQYLGWFADQLNLEGVPSMARGRFRRRFSGWLRTQAEQRMKQQNNNRNGNNPNTVPGTNIPLDYVARQLAIINGGK